MPHNLKSPWEEAPRKRFRWSGGLAAGLIVAVLGIGVALVVTMQPTSSGREVAERALAEMETHHQSDEPAKPAFDEDDFIDDTSTYAGQEISLNLKVSSRIFGERGESLRQFAGKSVDFTTRTPSGNSLDVRIHIPRELKDSLPNAVFLDRLQITFKCNKGDLHHGNEAITIERTSD